MMRKKWYFSPPLIVIISLLILFTGCIYRLVIPLQISLTGPSNGTNETQTFVTLSWEATTTYSPGVYGALFITGYKVYFAKTGDPYDIPAETEEKTIEKTNLEYGMTYKWQVVAEQSDGQNATSVEYVFTTVERAYTDPEISLISPVNGSTGQATLLTLSWEATPGAQTNTGERTASLTGYTVYFGKNGEGYPAPQWVTGKALQKSELEYNTTYKWQVAAVQSDGRTMTSTERTFTTAEMYGAPEIGLKTPANLTTGQATTLTLSWEATPGSETAGTRDNGIIGYDIYLAKASESYGAPQRVSEKEVQKSSLEYGMSYKWKVVAYQSDGKSSSSEQWVFNTIEEAHTNPQVALRSPANGVTGQATSLTLSWEATPGSQTNVGERAISLSGYRVYFGKSGESYPAPQWVTVKTLQKTSLEYNTTYKWKVTAVQSDGKTATSAERIFTTAETFGAPEIALKTPGNLSTGQATAITLTWEATPGAETAGTRANNLTGYDFYFAKASEDYGVPQRVTEKEAQKISLDYETTYKWKVVAIQSDGKSSSSEQWAFTTAGETYASPQINLKSPTSGGTMVSLDMTLTWEATPGEKTNVSSRTIAIIRYDVYFAKASETYTTPEYVTEKQLEKKNLEPWTEYKWKVVVYQSDGKQTTTSEATFLTAYTFLMGNTLDPADGDFMEKPVHGVVLTYQFEIGTYEVTFDQYDAYLLVTGQPTSTINDHNWGRGNRPVIHVTWYDAVRYCNWLSDQVGFPRAYSEDTWELLDGSGLTTTDITTVKGWRLATEAEWEYSARGGSVDIVDGVETNDYLYVGSDTLDGVGWYRDNSGLETQPVGQKTANEMGLYDMSGNVWEWCHDWYGSYDSSTKTNPIGYDGGSERVSRGGCWYNFTPDCRTAGHRYYLTPSYSANNIGFRIARTVF
jgi:formylglycine-generating enzyme required for sulfatase activity